MRVPDEVLKCVCFLCVKEIQNGVERMRYGGTGFFVSVPAPRNEGMVFKYLVTAKHVVERAETYGGLHVRVNTLDGGATTIPVNEPWVHGHGGCDVAVTPWPADRRFD